jgi:glucose-1-phosphate thymidylyltransferase
MYINFIKGWMMKNQFTDNLRVYLQNLDSYSANNLAKRADVLWDSRANKIHNKQNSRKPTEEGRSHCELVEKNIWKFIKESGRCDDFNYYEFFILSCSACCHDFDKGLLMSNYEDKDHGRGSSEFVYKNYEILGLTRPEAIAIEKIIEIHDLKGNEYEDSLCDLEVSFSIGPNKIRLRLLAALLKVGDVLHTDYSRSTKSDKFQGIEYIKYLFRSAVTGWDIDGKSIVIQVCPENSEEKKAIKKCYSYMRKYEWKPLEFYLSAANYPSKLEYKTIESSEPLCSNKKKIDCIILCGGYATRLWPLTHDLSKVLLPIAGKPCLGYVIDQVNKIDSLNNKYILINKKFEDQFEYYIKKNKLEGFELIVEPEIGETEKWGPIQGLSYLFTQKNKDYESLIIGGDNIFHFDLNDFIESASIFNSACIAIYRSKNKESTTEYGIVEISEGDKITSIKEKPTISHENFSTAVYYLKNSEIEELVEYSKSDELSDNLGNFFNWLVEKDIHISSYVFSTHWFDIGNRNKMLAANQKLIKNANDGKADNLTKEKIKKPSYIKKNVTLNKSEIGPFTLIEENCFIENSVINNSIIMEGSKIINSEIKNSIIGPKSIIEGYFNKIVCGQKSTLRNDSNSNITAP